MKKRVVSLVSGIMVLAMAMAYAESEAINPAKVTTPRIVVYGTTYDNTFSGNVNIAGTLTTTGTLTSAGTLAASGAATVGTTLNVTGASTLAGGATVKGRAAVMAPSTTYYMLESGTTAGTLGATITQAFTTVFSSVPSVQWRYSGAATQDVGGTAILLPTVTTASVVWASVQTSVVWTAVGLKAN